MAYTANEDGILVPGERVSHRSEEYPEVGFDMLRRMQRDHFWYRGRHKFIFSHLKRLAFPERARAIDLGGGCGGWIQFLQSQSAHPFSELAMGDSSTIALCEARRALGKSVPLYQIDLLKLDWRDEWDAVFLLDVLEHIPDDEAVLLQVADALKPGGKLIVTTPALDFFWSYNDEFAKHVRRYDRQRFRYLASRSNLSLLDARYFMFLLSPLYLIARRQNVARLSLAERSSLIQKQHAIPCWPINAALAGIFGAESTLDKFVRFPWGTSIMAVYEKRRA